MADAPRYALSFTSGALLTSEAMIVAPIYLREHDWAKVRELIAEDNLLQSRTVATGQRRAREVVQRLAVLSDDELELLVDATTSKGFLKTLKRNAWEVTFVTGVSHTVTSM